LEEELAGAAVLLDGVLGTGIKLPLREPLDSLLAITGKILNSAASKPAIVAVDCPSGIDCDSGEAAPVCLRADLTVTMAAVKAGTLKFPAYRYLGDLEIVEIGLPKGLEEWDRIKREVIQPEWVAAQLPERPLDAHKGTFGTALIAAGSLPYPGAAALAGKSAYRIGTGLVTMAVAESIYTGLMEAFPEATWIVLEENGSGIRASAVEQIASALGRPTACLLGPGWGTGQSTREFLAAVLDLQDLPPLVVDADGLRLLAELPDWWEKLPAGSLLTPHPGEMSVLCGRSVDQIQADRVLTAETWAREWGQNVLLKGAHTVIADPSGETRILIGADPALARAGSGDVLAGMITGLIAQGLSPFAAAAAGSWLHVQAGHLASDQAGSPAAVLAGGISEMIGPALAELVGQFG
jgi:NAD(P)H-hydrate epimerase